MIEDGKFDTDENLGDKEAVIDGDLDPVDMIPTVVSKEI